MDELIRCSKSGRVRTVALCLVLFCLSSLAGAGELPRYARLTILHTNDVHGHFMPFAYQGERDMGGIARRATLIDGIRTELPDCVLVMDAGDVYTRGPLANEYRGKPDIEAMNTVPYDVMTLGNNEFKVADGMEGQRFMLERIKQARFPIVCANVIVESTGKTLVPPYVILNTSGVRVGIFGLTAPRVAEYPHAKGLKITDPIETSRNVVDEIKDKVDVIVALTHVGFDGYGLDTKLAKAVPEIDVIVGGDSHTWLPEPVLVKKDDSLHAFWVGGPVIVQDGEWGHSLGRLDLIFRRSGEHDYQVMSYKGHLIPVNASVPARKDVERVLDPYVRPYTKVVGKLAADLPDGKLDEWVLGLMRKKTGAEIGFIVPWTLGGSLYAGNVSTFDVYSVLAFRNDVVIADLTGEQLQAAAKELVDGSNPPALSGVELGADGKLVIRGKEIESSKVYSVATTNFEIAALRAMKDAKSASAGINLTDLILQGMKN